MFNTIFNAAWVGALAGLFGGMVRFGWTKTLPPRSQMATQNGPIEIFLQELGLTKKEAQKSLIVAGNQRIPVISLSVYYVYSMLVAIFFVLAANFDGRLTYGLGTMFGFVLWIVVDILFLPAFKTIPFFWHRSVYELAVEMVGYLIFGWAVYLVALGLPISGIYL
ncbi:DUF1440 domain-containing protein [Fructobacillus cardui]|uniref:DUF1440 family (YagU) n=1 Tax=Fructobacillus cardui TaxID=2893170 RepID=A0ABM9MTY6_9LACO|nr:DUF1440 family (YagU) [Fructobacillus cardui]CAK1247051.1 DUF1440 family (YagU) [Fructobacillus cardui]CAK1248099.1 DUF1440 family (YagU) [Fructobacillus cardui]